MGGEVATEKLGTGCRDESPKARAATARHHDSMVEEYK